MKKVCTWCNGTGEDSWQEDNFSEIFYDTCYHCRGKGQISDDLARSDKLVEVCQFIARARVCDYRDALNSSPDGEGFDFEAYENNINPRDYIEIKFDQYTRDVMIEMGQKTPEEQQIMIAMYDAMESEAA